MRIRKCGEMILGLTEEAVVKKLILMATSLAMLPATAVLAVAQTEAGSEVQDPSRAFRALQCSWKRTPPTSRGQPRVPSP